MRFDIEDWQLSYAVMRGYLDELEQVKMRIQLRAMPLSVRSKFERWLEDHRGYKWLWNNKLKYSNKSDRKLKEIGAAVKFRYTTGAKGLRPLLRTKILLRQSYVAGEANLSKCQGAGCRHDQTLFKMLTSATPHRLALLAVQAIVILM